MIISIDNEMKISDKLIISIDNEMKISAISCQI